MVVVVAVVMVALRLLLRAHGEVAAMTAHRGVPGRPLASLLLAVRGVLLRVPLLAMLDFSTQDRGSDAAAPATPGQALVQDDDLPRRDHRRRCCWRCFTVVLMVVLLVPTMIWVRLRVPRATRLIEFLCLLPLTIPALVIVVGLSNVYAWVNYLVGDSALDAHVRLRRAGAALRLPGDRRRAVRRSTSTTLAEAARSLGAGWFTVIVRVIVPNI